MTVVARHQTSLQATSLGRTITSKWSITSLIVDYKDVSMPQNMSMFFFFILRLASVWQQQQ